MRSGVSWAPPPSPQCCPPEHKYRISCILPFWLTVTSNHQPGHSNTQIYTLGESCLKQTHNQELTCSKNVLVLDNQISWFTFNWVLEVWILWREVERDSKYRIPICSISLYYQVICPEAGNPVTPTQTQPRITCPGASTILTSWSSA